MQVDTELVEQIRNYIQDHSSARAIDVVDAFYASGIPKEKTLYILREIFG